MVAEVTSDHFVPQFSQGLEDRGVVDAARVCPDSGLTRV
jgi:hypothetical protein